MIYRHLFMPLILCAAIASGCAAKGEMAAARDARAGSRRPPQATVHFASGSASLLPAARAAIAEDVAWLESDPSARLVFEGHCDRNGGDLMNIKLGDRRARSVKAEFLRLGVTRPERLLVISYGKRRPADPNSGVRADGKNRRVEIVPLFNGGSL